MRRLSCLSAIPLWLLGATAQADDPVPLDRTATADDVHALFEKMSKRPIEGMIEAGPNGVFGTAATEIEQERKQASALIQGASSKALLEAYAPYVDASIHPGQHLSQVQSNSFNWITRRIFEDAIKSGATEADIPDLLSSTLVLDELSNAPGPDAVFHHPAWCNSPAASASLSMILKKLQSSPPEFLGQNNVLEVANLNREPAIQTLLQDTLTQACHDSGSPPGYLFAVFDAINHSTNPSIHALIPDVVAALAKYAPVPGDPAWSTAKIYQQRSQRISQLILKGDPPLQSRDFVANATICLTPPEQFAYDSSLALARLSGSTPSPTPENSPLPVKPGDSNASVAQSPATPPPTNSPALGTSSGDLPALSSSSPEAEVGAFVTTAVNNIIARSLTDQQQQKEVASSVSRLSQVKIKILLDLWREVPVLYLGVSLDGKDHSDADWLSYKLKSQILEGAIRSYSKEADASDLVASKTSFGYQQVYYLMKKYPNWSNSATAAVVLTDELRRVLNEPPTMLTDAYYEHSPTFNSILQVADHSNNPAVLSLLKEIIDQAINGSNTPPLFLLLALQTEAMSENRDIHGELPNTIARIAKLHHNDYEGAAVRGYVEDPNKTFGTAEELICGEIASNVAEVVQKNPTYLRNHDFISSAIACLKASNNSQERFPLALALLGDSTHFGDSLEKYYAFTSKKTLGNEEKGQANITKYQADEIKKWLISSIVYNGNGNKDQDIQDHYHDAVYQNGQWVLTMPDYMPHVPQQPVADSSPVTPAALTLAPPPADGSPMALPQHTSSAPPSAADSEPPRDEQKISVSVAVTRSAPIEQIDSSGQDTGVSMAAVGTTYTVVRVDGDKLILKDSTGNQYRLPTTATDYPPQQR